jgi:hypothetical protein
MEVPKHRKCGATATLKIFKGRANITISEGQEDIDSSSLLCTQLKLNLKLWVDGLQLRHPTVTATFSGLALWELMVHCIRGTLSAVAAMHTLPGSRGRSRHLAGHTSKYDPAEGVGHLNLKLLRREGLHTCIILTPIQCRSQEAKANINECVCVFYPKESTYSTMNQIPCLCSNLYMLVCSSLAVSAACICPYYAASLLFITYYSIQFC